MYLIHENVTRPSMAAEYEAAAREFVALVHKHPDLTHVRHTALVTDDFVYAFVFPIASYADLDAIAHDFAELGRREPAVAEINHRSGEATIHHRSGWIITEVTESQPEDSPDERWYDVHHLRHGREAEAVAAAKEMRARRVFTTLLGHEYPALIVENGERAGQRLMACTRRFERKHARVLRELTTV